ncbi:hypothetical protein [Dietzia timorensis]|uniref:hypothetical protein n=1 Tax=Dietzia timorensis TaxID=499555 RepID=UPI001E3DF2DD|nr:hypothetical protein [Dietzia timorensis]
MQVGGGPASSTNERTWTSWGKVRSGAGDGFGFMLGDGVGCIDLDHCLDENGAVVSTVAAAVLDANPGAWVEVSRSGRGLHVWGLLPEGSGRRVEGCEVYSRARFMVVTGRVFRAGRLVPLTVPAGVLDAA